MDEETTHENGLRRLLETPTLERATFNYEQMFDEFVRGAGGCRVEEIISVPVGTKNADYYFRFADCELILELKQVTAPHRKLTVNDYFAKQIHERSIRPVKVAKVGSDIQYTVKPTARQMSTLAEKFRPAIPEHMKKAARQLKETDQMLPETGLPRFGGILLVNTNDYDLPLDLMHSIAHIEGHRQWKDGRFSKLDFVSCYVVDLFIEGQSPMQGVHVARSLESDILTGAIRFVFEQWLVYYGEAIGAQIWFDPEGLEPQHTRIVDKPFSGKIQLTKATLSSV